MRKRLLLSAVFGLVGLAVGIPIGDRLGIDTALALVGCGLAGAAVGYIVSIFLDVFLTQAGETSESEN